MDYEPRAGYVHARIAAFNLWTGMFEMTFPSFLMKQLFYRDSVTIACMWEQGIP
jgi:hypothetical protein